MTSSVKNAPILHLSKFNWQLFDFTRKHVYSFWKKSRKLILFYKWHVCRVLVTAAPMKLFTDMIFSACVLRWGIKCDCNIASAFMRVFRGKTDNPVTMICWYAIPHLPECTARTHKGTSGTWPGWSHVCCWTFGSFWSEAPSRGRTLCYSWRCVMVSPHWFGALPTSRNT